MMARTSRSAANAPIAVCLCRHASAKMLLFAEGSSCHGVELLGRGALGHTILMNRRRHGQDAFRAVLAPRSERFDVFGRNPFLGSMALNPSGGPALNRGVSVLAIQALAAFLHDLGVADIRDIRPIAYLAAAHHDLERHIAAMANDDRIAPDGADRLRAALADRTGAGGIIRPA